MLPAGSSDEATSPKSWSPEMRFAGRNLKEAGGVGSSASGLSATEITYRKGEEGEDEEESGREEPRVTPVEA